LCLYIYTTGSGIFYSILYYHPKCHLMPSPLKQKEEEGGHFESKHMLVCTELRGENDLSPIARLPIPVGLKAISPISLRRSIPCLITMYMRLQFQIDSNPLGLTQNQYAFRHQMNCRCLCLQAEVISKLATAWLCKN
jgi:hypothetical protein